MDLSPQPLTDAHSALYGVFRSYVVHEDELINNRLNWNFTIQGFLFAAYSLCVQKVADVRIALAPTEPGFPQTIALLSIRELQEVMAIIGLIGLAVSVFVWIGVKAAQGALRELEAKWLSDHKEYRSTSPPKTHGPQLPGLIGGGSPQAHNSGHLAPIALPVSFASAWTILLILLFYGKG